MSTYTVTNPTTPNPVRNPGIRATLTARAEQEARSSILQNRVVRLWLQSLGLSPDLATKVTDTVA